MRNSKIPRYIDSIPQIFFWEIDEFMILASCFGFGILMGGMNTLMGIMAGLFITNIFKRYKDNGLPGQLSHLFHWKNIFNLNPFYPKSGQRRMFK